MSTWGDGEEGAPCEYLVSPHGGALGLRTVMRLGDASEGESSGALCGCATALCGPTPDSQVCRRAGRGGAHICHHQGDILLVGWLILLLALAVERLCRLWCLHRGPHPADDRGGQRVAAAHGTSVGWLAFRGSVRLLRSSALPGLLSVTETATLSNRASPPPSARSVLGPVKVAIQRYDPAQVPKRLQIATCTVVDQ